MIGSPDMRPDWWHESWIRYAEFGDRALVLHKATRVAPYVICLLNSEECHREPTDDHAWRAYRGVQYGNWCAANLEDADAIFEEQAALLIEGVPA